MATAGTHSLQGETVPNGPRREELAHLTRLFLRLGTTAFGGPAAHIALMEDEVVRRRRWLTHSEFLDLLGAANLIPGPNSTEMAIHIGYRRAGLAGLIVAGSCFILPAALMTTALGWSYVRWGKLPAAEHLLYGVKPVLIAVVLQAIWGLGRAALKSTGLGILTVAAAAASLLGVNEILVLLFAGLLAAASRGRSDATLRSVSLPVIAVGWAASATVGGVMSLGSIFLFFAKIGSVLFGSGYVLLAFLRADLVDRWHVLTSNQLLDAIAVGQITPGPVFTTATFIGYLLHGGSGAVVATLGIFGPAFFFVAISGPLIPRIRGSRVASAFLDGVNVASLALMAVVTWELSRAAVVDWVTLALAIVSAALLLRLRLNSLWLVLLGAVVGIAAG